MVRVRLIVSSTVFSTVYKPTSKRDVLSLIPHPDDVLDKRPQEPRTQAMSAAQEEIRAQATPSRATSLRVLTLNVHGWHNSDDSSWQGLIAMLKAMCPDVIALQEATKHRVPALAHQLGDMNWTARHNCAILSRSELTPLESGQVVGIGRSSQQVQTRKEKRGTGDLGGKGRPFERFCRAAIAVANLSQPLEVVCLHLDHVRETNRLSQLRDLVQSQQVPGRSPFQVWCGDFNALTLRDYEAHELARITEHRARSNWEIPVDHITSCMTAPMGSAPLARGSGRAVQPGLGFVDCWHAAAEEASGPLGTSRFDSRIDYVYCSPALAAAKDGAEAGGSAGGAPPAVVRRCEHLQTIPHVSDHNAVFALLEIAGAGEEPRLDAARQP